VVTARALTITARDSDTQASGTAGLESEESVLIGESLPAEKLPGPFRLGTPLAGLSCRALMGTVVHADSGAGVAAASGGGAQSGRIAPGLGEHHPGTGFQAGLRLFSMTLEPPATAVRLAQCPR
jgi:Mg2+-importing ATPase